MINFDLGEFCKKQSRERMSQNPFRILAKWRGDYIIPPIPPIPPIPLISGIAGLSSLIS